MKPFISPPELPQPRPLRSLAYALIVLGGTVALVIFAAIRLQSAQSVEQTQCQQLASVLSRDLNVLTSERLIDARCKQFMSK